MTTFGPIDPIQTLKLEDLTELSTCSSLETYFSSKGIATQQCLASYKWDSVFRSQVAPNYFMIDCNSQDPSVALQKNLNGKYFTTFEYKDSGCRQVDNGYIEAVDGNCFAKGNSSTISTVTSTGEFRQETFNDSPNCKGSASYTKILAANKINQCEVRPIVNRSFQYGIADYVASSSIISNQTPKSSGRAIKQGFASLFALLLSCM